MDIRKLLLPFSLLFAVTLAVKAENVSMEDDSLMLAKGVCADTCIAKPDTILSAAKPDTIVKKKSLLTRFLD